MLFNIKEFEDVLTFKHKNPVENAGLMGKISNNFLLKIENFMKKENHWSHSHMSTCFLNQFIAMFNKSESDHG